VRGYISTVLKPIVLLAMPYLGHLMSRGLPACGQLEHTDSEHNRLGGVNEK
jgi:hypothetical protein